MRLLEECVSVTKAVSPPPPPPQVTVFVHLITADTNRTMRVTPDPARTSRLLTNSNNFQSSRRSSEDSLEDAGLSRDMRVRLQYYDWIFSSFYDDINMKFGLYLLVVGVEGI